MSAKVEAWLAQRAEMLAELDAEEARLRAELARIQETRLSLGVSASPRARSPREPGEASVAGKIVAWLGDNPGDHRATDIAVGVGFPTQETATNLSRLRTIGKIERTERGRYQALTPRPTPVEVPRRETPADRMARMNGARAGAS